MKKSIGIIALATMATTGAVAADLTPYVGLGVVIDSANTSAKRMGINPNPTGMADIFVQDAGGDMNFDTAIAGEFTAGIKYGHLRGEFEFALRSASEDDYNLFHGDASHLIPALREGMATLNANTSVSVKHNSYMFNAYYDFDIAGSKWQPYIGAGIGVGTYKQKAKVDINLDINPALAGLVGPMLSQLPTEPIRVTHDKTEFEWQVALGTAYHFTPNWAADVAYRFNSSTVGGEFVYAHELKLGARYSF